MNLVIDIGNTQTKCAVFKGNDVISAVTFPSLNVTALAQVHLAHPGITRAILSSVAAYPGDANHFLKDHYDFILLDHHTPLPFVNRYATPGTLGKDRIAAAAAAAGLFSKQDVLVIDAGTCITCDFINSRKEYLGGSISPGIKMRFKALHTFTGRLPLVEEELLGSRSLIGNTTESSIRNGVLTGVLEEVKGVIKEYRSTYKDIKTVLTGGDAAFFEKELKNSIFADPLLVLKGLNIILEFNAEK